MPRFPDCPRDDCRFAEDQASFTTAMAWTPVYDKHGQRLNHNPNTRTTQIACETCGGAWARITRAGETTFRVCRPPQPPPVSQQEPAL